MRILLFSGLASVEPDLLKSAVRVEKEVPGYTRADGTYVAPHRRHVLVNHDVSPEDVVAGLGSHSQRQAHRNLSRHPDWHHRPFNEKYHAILAEGTDIQDQRGAAAVLSGWRTAARAGRNPTAAQWRALSGLDRDRVVAELQDVMDAVGNIDHLSIPEELLPAASANVSTPVAAGSVVTDENRAQWHSIANSDYQNRDASGRSPRSDVPDTIEVYSGSDGLMRATFSFKNTGEEMAKIWVTRYLRGKGVAFDTDSVISAQVGDYHDDWVDVHVRSPAPAPAAAAAPAQTPAPAGSDLDPANILASFTDHRNGRHHTIERSTETRGGYYVRSWNADGSQLGNKMYAETMSTASAMASLGSGVELRRDSVNWVPPSAQAPAPEPAPEPAQAPATRVMEDRFVNTEGSHNKFWSVAVDGNVLRTRYGRIGTAGQSTIKVFGSHEEAEAEASRLRSSKRRGGYRASGHESVDGFAAEHLASQASGSPSLPSSVVVGDSSFERDANGDWVAPSGSFRPGSSGYLALNILSNAPMTPDEINAYTVTARIQSITALNAAGMSTEDALGKLFPAGGAMGVREGDTKVVNGVTYVLQGGRWHRQSPAEESQAGDNLIAHGGHLYRRSGGSWQMKNGRGDWVPVISDNTSRELEVIAARHNDESAPSQTAAASAASDTPAAAPVSDAEEQAIAVAMQTVQAPSLDHLSNSETNQATRRRVNQLRALAVAGDLDGVTNFSTSRTRSNYIIVDDYRSALLDAAHAARRDAHPEVAPAVSGAAIPEPPTITGRNMQNTALIAAQRKVNALYDAARSADPVAAILAIPTNRGNGYMNAADDYKTALLAHFGHHASGTPVSENHAPAPSAPVSAAHQEAPAPAPARRASSVPPERNPMYAVNPDGKTPKDLGFFPRPNVPLSWTVMVDGVRTPNGVVPWPDSTIKELARKYLAQPTVKQQAAKTYQAAVADRLSPMHPKLAEAASSARAAEAARAEAAAREQREAAERRRREMEQYRGAARAFIDKHVAQDAKFQPGRALGSNISRYDGNMASAGVALGLDDEAMKRIVQTLVVDFGGTFKFSASVSPGSGYVRIHYSCPEGITITRTISKRADGYHVSHDYFGIPERYRNKGYGKNLFKTSLGIYQALGVKDIRVHANIDVGGYAWHKYGFLIDQGHWDSERRRYLQKIPSLNLSSRAEKVLRQALNSSDPRNAWVVSDMKDGERSVGKELMLGTNWWGTMSFGDEQSYRRCIGYVMRGG